MSPSQQANQEGSRGNTEWDWVRLISLVGLAATHYSSEGLFLVFNSMLIDLGTNNTIKTSQCSL